MLCLSNVRETLLSKTLSLINFKPRDNEMIVTISVHNNVFILFIGCTMWGAEF